MEIIGYSNRVTGKAKSKNEDYCLVNNKLKLYIVCDGSTQGQGHKASELACLEVQTILENHRKLLEEYNQSPTLAKADEIKKTIDIAIQSAAAKIFQNRSSNPEWKETFTTITLLLVLKNCYITANLGNSRIYEIGHHKIQRLTQDNTLFEEAPPQQKEQFEKFKNILRNPKKDLTKALGQNAFAQVKFETRSLIPGDTFLLSTDGFHDSFQTNEALLKFFDEPLSKGDFAKAVKTATDHVQRIQQEDDASLILVAAAQIPTTAQIPNVADQIRNEIKALSGVSEFFEIAKDEATLRQLHSLFQPLTVPKGRPIFSQGDKSDSMFVIIKGSVNVIIDGAAQNNAKFGDIIGELGFFTGMPRTATVIPTEDTRFLVMQKKDYDNLLIRDKDLALKINRGIINTLVKLLTQARSKPSK